MNRPNGLAFSPDETKIYIVEAGVAPRVIRAYDVVDDGTKLANSRPFITAEPGGTPDGFRLDVDGNLWCGWGMGNEKQDGVKIFDATGKPIGFIGLPERCANVCFGGVKRNRLFMAASHSLYSLYVNAQGAPGGSGSRDNPTQPLAILGAPGAVALPAPNERGRSQPLRHRGRCG